jgi:hypothetical protein
VAFAALWASAKFDATSDRRGGPIGAAEVTEVQ